MASRPGTMQVLSSLCTSMATFMHARFLPDHTDPLCVTHPASLIAADMMRMAAHQLQQPGADQLGALGLAAAGQRLAAVCAQVIGHGLLQHTPASDSSSSTQGCQQQQEGQQEGQQQQEMEEGEQQQEGRFEAADGSTADDSDEASPIDVAKLSLQALQAALAHLHTAACQSSNRGHTCVVIGSAGSGGSQATTAAGSGSIEVSPEVSLLRQAASDVRRACIAQVQLVGCSHLRCTNLSGPSAEGLVAGRKGVRCGRCRVARYCSPACQQADWPQHWRVCRRLAAAAGQGR
jgi:hypothetical protein